MKSKPAVLLLLMLCGCAPSIVTMHGQSTDPNAPLSDGSGRGGIARYGYSTTRKCAYKEMHESCDGPYKVTNEEARIEPVSGAANAYKTQFVYLHFECVDGDLKRK
jgi:hypothetical protein